MMRTELQKARKKSPITQKDIAEYLNVSETQYQRIEYGTSDTSSGNWLKLYHLFKGKYQLDKLMENTPKEN